jgi:hypothetical protein
MIDRACSALLALAGGLLLLAPGANAADDKLCAIKRIQHAASGVNISFVAGRQVMVMHDQEGDLLWIDAAARDGGTQQGLPVRHSLALKEGEEAYVINSATERCRLVVNRVNGRIGIDVEVSTPNAQPYPSRRTTGRGATFLPAE